MLLSSFHCVAIYKLGQSCEVILQTAAQVQMLPVVFRIVRDFTHEGVTIQKRKKYHQTGNDTKKSTSGEDTFENKP